MCTLIQVNKGNDLHVLNKSFTGGWGDWGDYIPIWQHFTRESIVFKRALL